MTLYVRNPSKLPSEFNEPVHAARLRVMVGELDDQTAIETALSDSFTPVEAVVSFIGPYASLKAFLLRTKTTPIADAIPTLLKAMKNTGVKRILALSSSSWLIHPEPDKNGQTEDLFDSVPWDWWFAMQFVAFVLPQGFREMEETGRRIALEGKEGGWGLKWTVFRVPHLSNGSADAPVSAGYIGNGFAGLKELSRKSMVRWVANELEAGEWINTAPVVANTH